VSTATVNAKREESLTPQQAQIIGHGEGSVSVSAGAGCGKTFVLTERFLAHFDPVRADCIKPEDLGSLVAITFTDRAAREMRQRIRTKCVERLRAAPAKDADYWLKLLRAIEAARISTIHAFCAALLRTHAVEAGLDPQFTVFEEAQAETLLFELTDDLLRDGLDHRDDLVLDLITELGLEKVRQGVARLVSLRHQIDFDEWEATSPEELVERWREYQQQVTLPTMLKTIGESPAARQVLAILRTNSFDHPKMADRQAILLDLLPSLPNAADPSSAIDDLIKHARVQECGGKKVWPDDETYASFRDSATEVRDLLKAAKPMVDFDAEKALPAAVLGLQLLRFTRRVTQAYAQEKQTRGALDFDDLLMHATELLTAEANEDVRSRLERQIRTLMVDEFQDTNPLQVRLVEALCGEALTSGKLFFVGDFKQSIYRFRGADPEVFRRLQQRMPDAGQLPLTLNFRSQPAVLNFVNALFCDEFAPDYEPLEPHRPQVTEMPAAEVMLTTIDPAETKGAVEQFRRAEADTIARRLRMMLEDKEPIVAEQSAGGWDTRPARPGDIALLFRALSNVQFYEEALRRYGLDYYLVGGHAFYAQQEIFDVLNLLRSAQSVCDDVALAGVLRSPMFALTDETLFWLSRHPAGLSFGLFEKPRKEIEADQRTQTLHAAATLSYLREQKDRMPIAQLLREAFARTGYDATLLAEFLGERKLANLHKLLDQARSFDRQHLGLPEYILQLSRFVASQPREALAATQPESADVVLMTVHQAKGLEFPVVVVPDIDRSIQTRLGTAEFDPRLGPLLPGKDKVACGYSLLKKAEEHADHAERIRLFYVACTRACDYLILSAGMAGDKESRGRWLQLLESRVDLSTGQCTATLPKGYEVPEIRITRNLPPLEASQSERGAHVGTLLEKAEKLAAKKKSSVPTSVAPIAANLSSRRQFSFSRISGALQLDAPNAEAAEKQEAASKRHDPLALGSLVHAVLEEVDFERPADIDSLVERFAHRFFAERNGEQQAARAMVAPFLQSQRAQQIASAKQVYRELEFLLAWPPGTTTDEPPYIQGVIDCLYQDATGGWHVVDYKTNRTDQSRLAQTAAGYRLQMLVYSLAIEKILGVAPVELVLCFLQPGLESRVVFDEESKREAIERVNQSIAAMSVSEA